jgi:hypothetical protein
VGKRAGMKHGQGCGMLMWLLVEHSLTNMAIYETH